MLKFKILILQRVYALSDEQTEVQTLDRRSFGLFLDLTSGGRVPNQNTIRNFRERLVEHQLFEVLFARFYYQFEADGLVLKEGILVDGSYVEVPRQRNTREENALNKADKGDTLWPAVEWHQKANKRRHKDIVRAGARRMASGTTATRRTTR